MRRRVEGRQAVLQSGCFKDLDQQDKFVGMQLVFRGPFIYVLDLDLCFNLSICYGSQKTCCGSSIHWHTLLGDDSGSRLQDRQKEPATNESMPVLQIIRCLPCLFKEASVAVEDSWFG